jgi:thiamine phosphate synthase YjbQ (UPF0047 family)
MAEAMVIHTASMLLGVSETIPIEKGRMLLTEKQSIFWLRWMDQNPRRNCKLSDYK